MTLILYSSLYGLAEPMNPDCFGGFRADRTVLVSDRPREVPPGVELLIDSEPAPDPVRASRRSKLAPHRFFPDATGSIYLDNKSRLLTDPRALRDAVFAQPEARDGTDFFAFPHFRRDCVYQEIGTVLENGLDDPAIVRAVLRDYRRAGMPEHAGLIEGHFLIRRHTPATEAFGEAWLDAVFRFSRRDQISFPYLAWKTGFRHAAITARPRSEVVIHSVFDRSQRRPDFPRQHVLRQALRPLARKLFRRS